MLSTILFVTNDAAVHQTVKKCLREVKENTYLIPAFSCADAARILKLVTPDIILFDTDSQDTIDFKQLQQLTLCETLGGVPVHLINGKKGKRNGLTQEANGVHNRVSADKEYSSILTEIINNYSNNTLYDYHSKACG